MKMHIRNMCDPSVRKHHSVGFIEEKKQFHQLLKQLA